MMGKNLLQGKRILLVDDESDVLDALQEELDMASLSRASTFEEAKLLLENQHFDIAILDIMGVNGYELLEIARKKNIISLMLTAHALSTDNIVKARQEGAASFLPKEEMKNIIEHLSDLLEAKEKGKDYWWHWYEKMSNFCGDKFGPNWQDKDREFWEALRKLSL
ncbi:Response regulator receiver domain protein [uncultured Desulfatiglans sp.]|uniref:Response regulator receiver domain protein n=1 Tax=Uncultured Desulfatiglans sp. TaxID=1748965 RepID=A0A653AAW9_UNCDX|nr:Response regulator receiver domain protein [uncultured Desulfatiglans sp.]